MVGNDGILHERKVAEVGLIFTQLPHSYKEVIIMSMTPSSPQFLQVSIRSIKRQKRPFYRLQCTLNSRKKGRSEEWFDGETVQAHSPEALEEVDRIEVGKV